MPVAEEDVAHLIDNSQPVQEAAPGATDGLVVAAGDAIYCVDVDAEEAYPVRERPNTVWSLIGYKDLAWPDDGECTLMDSGAYGELRNTVNDALLEETGYREMVNASHGGAFVTGLAHDSGNADWEHEIIGDGSGTPEGRAGRITSLSRHSGVVYDAGYYQSVCKTDGCLVEVDADHVISAHTVRGGKYGERVHVYADHPDDGRCIIRQQPPNSAQDRDDIAARDAVVNDFVAVDGTLYDVTGSGGRYGAVHRTEDDPDGDDPLLTFDTPVEAAASVTAQVWDQLMDGRDTNRDAPLKYWGHTEPAPGVDR